MSVLAVIPCLNEAAHLPALLQQMLRDPAISRIVVADGGSTDGSRAVVERLAAEGERVVLLPNPHRIQSAGINLAVAKYGAGHQWLLRIDAHCLYPDSYAALLLASAERSGAKAVVVPMITTGTAGFQLAVATAQNSILGTGGSAHRHVGSGRFVDHGHHALMDMALFRQVGGYCEAMPCNEDAELDHRQTTAGATIWLEPSAAITYFPRRTPGSLWRQYFGYGIGRARNLRRHSMRLHLRQIVPLAVPVAVMILPLTILHPIFALPAVSWLLLCLLAGALIGFRTGGEWRVLAGLAAAIMHLAWGLGFLRESARRRPPSPRYGLLHHR